MCFSVTTSFIAGGTLSAVGVLTLSKAKTKAEMPFASIPLLFGVQQLLEGVVWLSFSNPALDVVSTYGYSLFSHVIWPIFVPFSILLLEKDPVRKIMLMVSTGIGVAVGIYLFYFIFSEGITSEILNKSISYDSPHLYLPVILTLYVIATCVSFLISSHKIINIIGIVMTASFFIAGWFFSETFVSVWCFFAAIVSVLVFWYIIQNTGKSDRTRQVEKDLITN